MLLMTKRLKRMRMMWVVVQQQQQQQQQQQRQEVYSHAVRHMKGHQHPARILLLLLFQPSVMRPCIMWGCLCFSTGPGFNSKFFPDCLRPDKIKTGYCEV